MSNETIIIVDPANNNTIGVTAANEMKVKSDTGIKRAALLGDAYTISMLDPAADAGEYSIYLTNTNSAKDFVITKIETYAAQSDVEWILTTVTGTATSATELLPQPTNIGTTQGAALTCRGGATGVSNLTPVTTIKQWFNGIANTMHYVDFKGSLIVPYGAAVAIKMQAGTQSIVRITIHGYFK